MSTFPDPREDSSDARVVREALGTGVVLLCPLPGRVFGSIAADLGAMRARGVVRLVSLITLGERRLCADELPREAASLGIALDEFPLGDGSAPLDVDPVTELVDRIVRETNRGRGVAIHCFAGHGRTGTLAACCAVRAGISAVDAIALVRRARPMSVENPTQEAFVGRFEAALRIAPRSLTQTRRS